MVVIGTDSTLGLTVGSTARTASYLSKTAHSITYRYTVQAGDMDTDGIAVGAITANSTTVRDSANNNANLSLTGHLPATTGVLVDAIAPAVTGNIAVPANGTYVTGQALSFTVTFDENFTVTGTDSTLGLTVGSTARTATYASKTANSITYTYAVQAGDLDTDGITIGNIALNTSMVQDGAGNNANLSLTGHVPSTTAVLVDGAAPTVTGNIAVPAAGSYRAGQALSFTVSFDDNVTITGIDSSLNLTIGATARSAAFVSKSANSITYSYTVQDGEVDGNGITVGSLSLGSTTIRDAAGNNANVSLGGHVPSLASVLVDAAAPTVTSVSVPANGTYKAGDNLDFVVGFNEAITVDTGGGTPRIEVTIGNTLVNATYIGGTGTNTLTFRHTIAGGSVDTDGISVGSSIVLDGATLKDSATNNVELTLNSIGTTSNVLVDAVAPTVTSVSIPENGTYKIGQNLDFTINFSESVTITSGTPSIDVTLDNGGTVQASYISGSGTSALVFRYTVATGTADVDGIALAGAIAANGATIMDAAGNSAMLALNNAGTTTGVLVDGVSPSVVSINRVGSTPTGATSVDYTVTFDESISGLDASDFTLNKVGTANGNVTDVTAVNGSTYTVTVAGLSGDGDIRLDLNSSGTAISDTAGNAISSGYTSGQAYTLDHTGPTVTSVSVPPNATYKAGQNLDFTVNFSEAIVVNTAGGTPKIVLDIGGVSVDAMYVSGSGTSALTFRYTIADGNVDSNGIGVGSSIDLSGSTLKDATSNDAALTFNNVGSTVGVMVDTVAPVVAGNISVPANATYTAGQTLDFTVTFSENVTITGTDSSLELTIGNATRSAVYAVNNANSVTYRYTVQSGDSDSDGIAVGAISLGTSTITDGAGNNANVVLTSHVPNTTGILVDTVSPAFTSATANGNTLVIAYAEATSLDATNMPAAGAFAVMAGNTAVTVNSVAINAISKTVTLTLASAVSNGQVVTVAYTDPTGGNDANALQDAAGNDAATLAVTNVTNNTPAPPSGGDTPTSTNATIDGVTVQTGQVTNLDGTTSTKLTIPVVEPTRTEQVGNNTVADIPLVKSTSGESVLTAQIPTGLGMNVTGSTAPKDAGSSVADLIREIKAHTDAGSHDQDSLSGAGTGFLQDLPADTPLLVQTIVPTVANNTAPPTKPLVITGTPQSTGNPLTALVIDTRSLPSNTEIQLQHIEFAAVIGNVKVTGGEGSQTVYGDGGSQYIYLGADDDVLHGGAGDDTVGSAGGNDKIFGDEGNDLVFGGQGNDAIDGGTGMDTVRLVGSGRSDYTMRVENGKLALTHRHGGIDGTDTVTNVEKLNFAGGDPDMTARGIITRMYDAMFDRAPDQQGLDYWVKMNQTGMSMHDIANRFVGSLEAQTLLGAQSNAQFIDTLYQRSLGRVADTAGREYWLGLLEQGKANQADVMYALANSNEKLAQEKSNGYALDFSRTDVATFVRMYDTLFDRKGDESGLNYWIGASENGMAIRDIAASFIQSTEAQSVFGSMSNIQFIDYLYKTGLGRQGGSAEVTSWAAQLDSGAINRGDALLGFTDSAEKIELVGVMSTSIETI